MPTDMKALIERVESESGSDREVDYRIATSIMNATWWDPKRDHEYTSSLDDVLGLLETRLPGWCWQAKHGFGHEAIVWQVCKDYDDEGCRTIGHHPDSASRALLAAALRAIQESKGERDGRP